MSRNRAVWCISATAWLATCLVAGACSRARTAGAGVAVDVVTIYGATAYDGGLPVNVISGGSSGGGTTIVGNDAGNPVPISATSCTPISQYGVQAGLIKDAGATFYYAICDNTGSTTQYGQIQNQATSPVVDAGPAALQFPIYAGGATTTPALVGGAALATGFAFDVSSVKQYYVPDGGTSVNCTFCYQ